METEENLMKKINVEIALYKLNELSEAAKTRAIEEHRSFLLEIMCPDDFISGDEKYDTEEQLQETYEREYEYVSLNDDPVIESIEVNDYYFFSNGELADCTTYCGSHPKAGTTELKFMGNTYQVA